MFWENTKFNTLNAEARMWPDAMSALPDTQIFPLTILKNELNCFHTGRCFVATLNSLVVLLQSLSERLHFNESQQEHLLLWPISHQSMVVFEHVCSHFERHFFITFLWACTEDLCEK